MGDALFAIGNQQVKVDDILSFMKIFGSYSHAKRTVILNEVIREHALHEGLTIEVDALQAYSDLKRLELGMHSKDEFQEFLNKLNIDFDMWERTLENELLRIKLRNKIGSNIYIIDAWKLIKGIPEVREHISNALIAKGKEKGLNVTTQEIQETSDIARRMLGMHNAEEFVSVLNALNMSLDDWENYVHSDISLAALEPDEQFELFDREVKVVLQKYPFISSLINDIIYGAIIHAQAKKMKLTISDEEVNKFIEDFRRAFGLYSVQAFNVWLLASGMDLHEFDYLVQTELIKRKLADNGMPGFDFAMIEEGVKASTYFINALNMVKSALALAEEARSKGLNVSDDEAGKESDYLRRVKKLYKTDDLHAYLQEHELSFDFWTWYCETAAYIRKLYDFETTDEKLFAFIQKNLQAKDFIKNHLFSEVAIKVKKAAFSNN